MNVFPPACVLSLGAARARFAAGLMVTVTRDHNGADSSWAYACVRRDGARVMERAPGRRVRFQPADLNSPLVRFALALLDPSYDGYVANPYANQAKMVGVWLLSPAACTRTDENGRACGDTLSAPWSIRDQVGPTCGGRYAAQRERTAAKRATVANAWAGLLPGNMWTKLAAQATDQMERDARAERRAPACDGSCHPMTFCPTCDSNPTPAA